MREGGNKIICNFAEVAGNGEPDSFIGENTKVSILSTSSG